MRGEIDAEEDVERGDVGGGQVRREARQDVERREGRYDPHDEALASTVGRDVDRLRMIRPDTRSSANVRASSAVICMSWSVCTFSTPMAAWLALLPCCAVVSRRLTLFSSTGSPISPRCSTS